MERIKKRSMATFVVSSLLNFGIGFVIGFIIGIFVAIEAEVASLIIIEALVFGAIVAIFTHNMYRFYFYYNLSLDVNSVCKGDGKESDSYVVAFFLSNVTLGLYNIYWMYKIGQRLRANTPRYGFKMMETGKDIAVLDAFSCGYIAAWELIKNMNRIADSYNQQIYAVPVGGDQYAN